MSILDSLLEIFNKGEDKPLDTFTSKDREATSNNVEERSIFQVDNSKSEQVVQEAYFKQENNIHDIILDDVPVLVNGDGTKYYGPGDIRNTFDPTKKRFEEDYDGSIIQTGGDLSTLREIHDPNDPIDNFVPDGLGSKHVLDKIKEWREKNKVVNFTDFNKKQEDKPIDNQDKPTENG